MNISIDQQTLSKIEVNVDKIIEGIAILKIKDSHHQISWPIQNLPENIKLNDNLLLELKWGATATIKKLVEVSKKQDLKDNSNKQRLLEQLIN